MIRLPRLCALFSLCLLAASIQAQAKLVALPDMQKLTPSEQLDALLRDQVKPSEPGLAVMVIKDGRILFNKGYGMADLSTGQPLRADTPFYIASVAKQFTATAIMMLVEQGRLGYDDKLVKFFPEFKGFASTITIRQLLTHTSGLIDHLDVIRDNNAGWTNKDVVELLLRENRVLFEPGEKSSYSNSGYVLLAMVVEKISAQKFSAFLKKNIFTPLGMSRTFVVEEPGMKIPGQARGYRQTAGRWEPSGYEAFTTGAGGVYSTLEDLYRWDQSFYTEKLIKESSLKLASTPARLNNGRPTPYGFGWLAEYAAKGRFANVWYVASHGNFKGFQSIIKRIPDRRFTAIVLSNRGDLLIWPEVIQDLYLTD
jgi:CubicO group peptidase (beta-lactamase class C family)